ncbi:MAG: hypothetical protein AAF654_10870 [Myxococcota bacterium]
MTEVRRRLYVIIGAFALVALSADPGFAQVGDLIKEMKDAASFDDDDDEEEPAKKSDSSSALKVARVKGPKIVVNRDRAYAIRHKRIQLPWPEFEMLEPLGAEVAIYNGKRLVHEDEVPFVYKKAKIDQYLKLVVKESDTEWTVKLKPKKGHRTIIDGLSKKAEAVPARAKVDKRETCQSVLIAKGHDSMDLAECTGVNEACAVQMLKSGHTPQDLMFCKGVEPSCAVSLLKRGDDPTDLIDCK